MMFTIILHPDLSPQFLSLYVYNNDREGKILGHHFFSRELSLSLSRSLMSIIKGSHSVEG